MPINKFLTPPTSAALTCDRKQSGLLGGGLQPFSSVSASSFFMSLAPFAGQYEVDEYSAAWYLVYQLSSQDEQLTSEVYKAKALLLRDLIKRLKHAAKVSVEALKALQEAAEAIPEIGPLMFSLGNLPGTMASASGAVMATSKARKINDLLDMTPAQKEKLSAWARDRGKPGARSASKTFKSSINIISRNNKLFFEIPITAVGRHYKILGQAGQSVAHIPLKNTKAALNKFAHLHNNGATGALKFMGGNAVGFVIAVGPQALIDYSGSHTVKGFYNRTVESQPTNVASTIAGMVGGGITAAAYTAVFSSAAPLVFILAAGWGIGLMAQAVIVDNGWDKGIGDFLKL
jgi:hypothetical protein